MPDPASVMRLFIIDCTQRFEGSSFFKVNDVVGDVFLQVSDTVGARAVLQRALLSHEGKSLGDTAYPQN